MQSKSLPRLRYKGGKKKKSIYRLALANLIQKHCRTVTVPLLPSVSSSSEIALSLTHSPRLWSASLLVPSSKVNTRLWLVAGCCSGDAAAG